MSSVLDEVLGRLMPVMDVLERERRVLSQRRRWVVVHVVVWMVLVLVGLIAAGVQGVAWFLLLGLGGLCSWGYYFVRVSGPAGEYRKRWKRELCQAVVAEWGAVHGEMAYHPERGMSKESFAACGLFQSRVDRYRAEDYFVGVRGKTALEFSEVHAERKEVRRDSEGNKETRWETVFKGVLFCADFYKDFAGRVTVERNSGIGALRWLGDKMSGGKLVKMANVEFEKRFRVKGADQVEARYLITPAMQERLLALDARFGGGMAMALDRGRMWLAIERRGNMFEPRLADEVEGAVRGFVADLEWVCAVVDELDLNTRIWTKG